MADEQHVVRSISWTEVFSFPHIFKSFKMAIHPSKIILALLAIGVTYLLGMVMDPIWSGLSDSSVVYKDEAWRLWVAPGRGQFLAEKDKWLKDTRVNSLAMLLAQYPDITKEPNKMAKEDFAGAIDQIEQQLAQNYRKALKKAEQEWIDEGKRIKDMSNEKQAEEARTASDKALVAAKQRALGNYVRELKNLQDLAGEGIFASFLDWEGHCVASAISAVRRGNFATGVGDLLARRGLMTPKSYVAPAANVPDFDAGTNAPEGYGLVAWVTMMAWGVSWMISTYPVYSIIYIVIALAVWSLLGGAICRMVALHAAREEKISISAAVKFSLSKFLSFFTAPLLPLAIIVLIGAFMAGGGALGAIPGFGEWFAALLFFLALIGGALIAFLVVGLVGGAPLMWPTIAVEGSDSFDAISRSFSYIFARPFHYGLYWLVAAIHGTICYLFVRLFAFIALRATHCWVGWAMRLAGREHYATGAGKLDVMWPQPTFDSFHLGIQTGAVTGSEAAAAYVMGFWVCVVAGVVLAFLACYLFSASTTIYCLLRRKVDATDLDDVYVEEVEEEEAPAAEPPPAKEAPPGEAPAGQEEGGEEESG